MDEGVKVDGPLIPETFARYHQDGTSWDPADIDANIAAGLVYARERYGDPAHVKADTPDART